MSNNLPSKINHSLMWLNNNIKDIKEISNLTNQYLIKLTNISITKDGYSGKIKSDSSKYRKKLNEKMECILIDYNIYIKDIDEIVKYKNIDDVIYSYSKFLKLLFEYKKLKKETKKIYDKCEIEKDKAQREENYVLCIGISKIYSDIYRCDYICGNIIKKLNILLNRVDEI